MNADITRRAVLAGVPAIAAVAALPALGAVPVDDSKTLDAAARWQVLHNVLPIPLGAVEEYCQLCPVLRELRPQTIEGAVALLGCAAVRVRLEDAYKAGDTSIPDLLFYSDWTTKRILLASHDALQRLAGGAA